jgi:hypothetical protein
VISQKYTHLPISHSLSLPSYTHLLYSSLPNQWLYRISGVDMAKESEFPTTSSALEELKDGDYDIVQLSKKVDEAVKALNSNNEGSQSNGTKNKRNDKSSGTKAGEFLELHDDI